MCLLTTSLWNRRRGLLPLACALPALLAVGFSVQGQRAKVEVLRIGASGTLSGKEGGEDRAAVETLKNFITEETGLKNEISKQKDWRQLADNMAKGRLQVGVFQGYEFAWAKGKQTGLVPLALAVNVNRYPTAFVIVKRDNRAKDFSGLKGQSISLRAGGPGFLRLFIDHECQAAGKTPETFFSKISSQKNVEDALDDVVDGVVQATVVERSALEAYKRRKPGRFDRLKAVARSQPFPPPVVAAYGKALDAGLRARFRKGLLGANKKEKGRTMLTLFRLTRFEPPPADFDKALARTRKAYPPPAKDKTK
jgi:ABC-type phosphate/phosphonate transport system substrate-binding protein